MTQQALFRVERVDYALDEITIRLFEEKRRARTTAQAATRAALGPQTVVLISCGAQKLDAPAQARDLYTSTLFRKARVFAEAHADAFYILSAKHGLVSPEKVIAPYDFKLTQLRGRERGQWAGRVASDLRDRTPEGSRVVILAGRVYRSPLECFLVEAGFRVEVPTRGKTIFQLMSFLAAENRRRAA